MEPLKRLRSQLGQAVARAWERLSEGWREFVSRSSDALTPFMGSSAAMIVPKKEALPPR